jgi:hypothetical protein
VSDDAVADGRFGDETVAMIVPESEVSRTIASARAGASAPDGEMRASGEERD